jgi:hypothetical protein
MVKLMEQLRSPSPAGSAQVRSKLSRTTKALVGLEGFLAFWAYAGGGAMIVNPESGANLPRSFLEGAPFDSFLIPGILLVVSNGILPTTAVVGALRRRAWARRGHYVVGLAALAWIAGQIAVIGYVSWMQPFFFGLGLAILGLAYISDRGLRLSGHPGK